MTDKQIHIESTPASRWFNKRVGRVKLNFYYAWGTGLILLGIPFLLLPIIGVPFIIVGIGMIYFNYRQNKQNKKKECCK